MKHKLVAQVLTVLTIALGTPMAFNESSVAGGATFFCGTSTQEGKTVPATIGRTRRNKEITLIRWVDSTYFPARWSPQKRCEEVSQRFQRLAENGSLRFIKTGRVNEEPVACAVKNSSDFCTPETVLFTLKRGSNPHLTVRRLMDMRDGVSANGPLNESGCKGGCAVDPESPLTLDISAVFDDTSDEGNNQPTPQPPVNITTPSNTNNDGGGDDTLW